MRIAFYAPLKPPDHSVPSGDRRMARLLLAALRHAGHEADVASRLRAYALEDSIAAQESVRAAGEAEVDRLVRAWEADPAGKPELWFTYHLYYRAPDWIGPAVADALDIPYAVAEASFAMKRSTGVWALGHEATAHALARADVVFALASRDRPGLERVPGFSARIVDLAPFVETVGEGAEPVGGGPPVLLAVAMMRARAKVESYRILAQALASLDDLEWRLVVAGDGPSRPEVEAALGVLAPGRVEFAGMLEPDALAAAYRAADMLVWPGFDEAFGMAYLEAQAAGLPVVAMDHGGVGDVVRDGVSGRLVAAGDLSAYTLAVRELIEDSAARRALGRSARAFIARERSLEHAARVLDDALVPLSRAA